MAFFLGLVVAIQAPKMQTKKKPRDFSRGLVGGGGLEVGVSEYSAEFVSDSVQFTIVAEAVVLTSAMAPV